MTTYLQAPTQPKEGRPPCECNVAIAKRRLRVSVDDILSTAGLEWTDNLTLAQCEKRIDDLVDQLVATVVVCSDCKGDVR